MTVNHRTDHVLVRAAEFRPGDTGRLNEILDRAGLGRPLGEPGGSQGPRGMAPLIRVPVRAGADPVAIQAAVQAAIAAGPAGTAGAAGTTAPDGGGPPAVLANPVSAAGTLLPGVFFTAFGKKSGHGLGWIPAPAEELPSVPAWDQNAPHPVIALLDSGVQPHPSLPGFHPVLEFGDDGTVHEHTEAAGPPFLLDADGVDNWHSPVPPDNPSRRPYPPGTHWGHGTFIAGLIRQAAPQAQVLSMRVMDSKGHVDDCAAVHALTWLARPGAALPAVVLMAFGRQAAPADPTLDDLRAAVRTLAGQGVTVVASAGNGGSSQPVYPAAFAAELGPRVISVGAAMSPEFRAPYSNFGPWVTAGWLGTDIVSIHPQTIENAGQHQADPASIDNPVNPVARMSQAWWTGTSFAAAIVAGRLASRHRADVPPDPRDAGVVPMPEAVDRP